jgi:hypothetical protein
VDITAMIDLNPELKMGGVGFRPRTTAISFCLATIIASAVLYAIASGTADFTLAKGFAANGYGDHSPGKYSLVACLIAEVVLTMIFLFIIMGATHGKSASRLCSDRDWTWPHADSPYQHSGDEYAG